MKNTYPNWKCYAYHLYGDNSGKEYSYEELKEYFDIDGTEYCKCIKTLDGSADKYEYYKFYEGKIYRVDITADGMFRIK